MLRAHDPSLLRSQRSHRDLRVRLSWEILISRTARRLTVLAAAPAIALALSACSSSIDSGKLETTAADVLEGQVGVRPDIACDEDLPAEVDASTRCLLTDKATGEEYGVTITVTSVDGSDAQFDVIVDDAPSG
jgi:hypothetical protein